MPPIVCGLLPVVLVFVALCFPTATAQTLPAADMEVMRAALAAAQSGDWSRAYVGAATITDPLPLKMLHWMDYARPGAPAGFPTFPVSSNRTRIGRRRNPCANMPRRPWPANRTRSPPIGTNAASR